MFEYWSRICAGRKAPNREEVEPSDIRGLLADTFILEVSGTYRTISYRLAGTRLCAAFGRELKYYGFFGHWAEQDCFDVARTLAHVYRDQRPHVISMNAVTESGKDIDYEMLLLPLAPMEDGSARILGIATPSENPFWLGAEPLVECSLISSRDVGNSSVADRPLLDATPSLAPGLQPAGQGDIRYPSEFSDETSLEAGKRRIGHLVVHEGGKQ